MPTLEDRIRALEDRDAIRELTNRYCQHAVAGNAEAVAALFARDGIMESGDVREQGQARLLALYRETLGDLRPIPFVQNHVVELHGDRATGYSSVEVRMVENGEAVTAAGHYD
ncbi:nuclear transport factor 2 family protein, partial [Myxococcota bacterium]|nr:nuclear transport factor 2 family protein [Myxococcota bacterium]